MEMNLVNFDGKSKLSPELYGIVEKQKDIWVPGAEIMPRVEDPKNTNRSSGLAIRSGGLTNRLSGFRLVNPLFDCSNPALPDSNPGEF